MTITTEEPPAQVSHSKTTNHVKANTQCQPLTRKRLAHLIGKRCMVSCAINGIPFQMLLDSRVQVTGEQMLNSRSVARTMNMSLYKYQCKSELS